MKIGIIAPTYFPIPPEKYGGTESVVYYLTEGLVKKCHDVTLFCCEGSKTSAKMDLSKQIDITKQNKKTRELKKQRLADIIKKSREFDIIHNNDGIQAVLREKDFDCPIVSTWHVPFGSGIDRSKPGIQALIKTNSVSISNSQRNGLPEAKFISTVYNGTVDLSEYELGAGGEYLIWIGRFNEVKGAKDAIKIAKKAKKKLILAGSAIDNVQAIYFDRFIKNHIDNEMMCYVGEVDLKQKVPLLQKATAFLMPIHWEEPFGLVMIEALACGTPVIAYNRGSVPEIIEDGKNGYIVPENDIDGMVDAIKNIDKIDRKYCRESVKKRFSIEKMVSGYEDVYKKVYQHWEQENESKN